MTDHAVPAFNRFASRADAAIVTARQCRFVDPGWLPINSNSSSRSTAESWAWTEFFFRHQAWPETVLERRLFYQSRLLVTPALS
jgi:hypothetical protein